VSTRLLVVDDDAGIRELTRAILQGAGFTVSEAASGEEAFGAILRDAPELVLLDVNMPGMDGWKVLRLLQSDDRTRRLPVVMFSVKGEIRDKVHALQEGAFDYISKPFSCDELVDRVSRIVEAWRISSSERSEAGS